MCQQNSHHLLSASSFTSSKRTKPVLPFHFLYDCLCLKKIEGEIQDTGHFPKNLLVCTCITVDLDYVISLKPKTVPIQSMHQAKYSQNSQMFSWSFIHSFKHASNDPQHCVIALPYGLKLWSWTFCTCNQFCACKSGFICVKRICVWT